MRAIFVLIVALIALILSIVADTANQTRIA